MYAWDQSRVDTEFEINRLPASTIVVPETFARPRGDDGLRLVTMLEGYEGQFWSSQFLVATRWWPSVPTSVEWQQFARASGAAERSDQDVPVPIVLDFLERPWIERAFSLDQLSTTLQSARTVKAVAIAASCLLLFIVAQMGVVAFKKQSVVAELQSLRAANKAFGQNRAQAFANLDEINSLLALDVYPQQIDVLNAALAILGPAEARILSWSFDRGNLDIVVRGKKEFDPAAFITLFERDERFQSVSGTLVGQERDLQLKMVVEPRRTS